MKLLLNKWVGGTLGGLLTVGCFLALWFCSVNAPDDAVREIAIASPDWYLAEHRVGPKAYYTLRSDRGNTPWDEVYGNRPASLLYYQLTDDTLLLQRLNGSVLSVDLRTGSYHEVSTPSTPFTPLSALFPIPRGRAASLLK